MIDHFVIVADILRNAHSGKGGTRPQFLSAYQILNRFPDNARQELIQRYGEAGKGAGGAYSAVSYISSIARSLEGIEIVYLDTDGVSFNVGSASVTPGYTLCGLYRLG